MKVINPALNSVPYLFILNAHCIAISKGSKVTDLDTLCDKIDNFLEIFDGRQIRYLGKELTQLLDSLTQIARSSRQVCLLEWKRQSEC
jgi:COP9 signalosome complex subunit 3